MAHYKVAEGVGFEPTVGCPTLDFESSALNRTQPPFRDEKKNVESAYAKSSGVARAERPTSNVQRKYHADDPVACSQCFATRLLGRRIRQEVDPFEPGKTNWPSASRSKKM